MGVYLGLEDVNLFGGQPVQGGGGGNSFIVMLSWDDVDELWTPDKTVGEIQNAYTDGKEIAFICQDTFNPTYWYCDDDYAFVYGVYVADVIPNQFLQKEYLYNTYGVTSLGDSVVIYPNFEYPTRTYTPTESQQAQTITYNPNDGYNGIEEVSVTVNAIPSNYVGSGITRRSSSDLTASGATVSVPSGYYQSNASKSVSNGTAGTPTATKGAVSNHSVSVTPSVTNTTGYIIGSTKTGTAVTVSASELVSGDKSITTNGNNIDVANYSTVSVNVSGGGSSVQIGTSTVTLSTRSTAILFENLLGQPTSFYISSVENITTAGTVTAVEYDGTDIFAQYYESSGAVYDGIDIIFMVGDDYIEVESEAGAEFQVGDYKLVYTYNGTSACVNTADVQVGSGATSITFTDLEDEPLMWSCVFKSNFSTSSGYQRVICVANDGTNTYGMEMDSSAKYSSAHWTATYNNGSLTITSQGTNAGGYFHQPGYYQLTYCIGGEINIDVEPLNVTQNGVYSESGKAYSPVTVNVSGGSSKNVQTVQQGATRVNSTSYAKACGDITVSKTGTYDVYWTCYRTSTSGSWGTRLYIEGVAQAEQTTFSSYYQTVHLSNISLTANQVISVYAKSRGTQYYAYVGQLTIIEA